MANLFFWEAVRRAHDEELANDYSWYPEWSVAEICEASLPQFAVSALWLLISLLLTSTLSLIHI